MLAVMPVTYQRAGTGHPSGSPDVVTPRPAVAVAPETPPPYRDVMCAG